ncbi:LruC domain-containing protein [Marinomonas transparens]|uniref:LruC domain-containing protein n=1 Tax=Marinomonas transparens TaxID=2795388 RepID=A0A934JSK3_9GAMM|nr:LruC domain-containing protein [Marinomonas transparens]MBJ7539968.1 LruC domain-containing protein [Marinomonas transparens]
MIHFKTIAFTSLLSMSFIGHLPLHAEPFNNCPTNAFLIQGKVAKLYSVDLATGFYETLSDNLGTNSVLNAMAYNFHDNYLYAYSREFSNIVRIHADYTLESLAATNMSGANFYVGDISLTENKYYLYRPGSAYGLFQISLDPSSDDYLVSQRIVDGSTLKLEFFDFAAHPSNHQLYAVDRSGNLHQIDVENGTSIALGNVGQSGTFGASYFDQNGTFYISRNSDGHIYRIDVSAPSPVAEFFANGPSSSQNDGARCALSGLLNEDSRVDFGDAPESYGSNLDNNGARHSMSDDLYLGTSIGGNDDGVTPVTTFEQGLDTAVAINTKGSGVVNVWVDWQQDGQFDNNDQVVTDQTLIDGANLVVFDTPVDAETGTTWMRTRYSSVNGIGPNGGVSDGEVEDYQIVVSEQGTTIHSYPSTNTYTTLAYEDKWPVIGDYDMNDVVVAYRTHRFVKDEQANRYVIEGSILAHGASYSNGFAIQLDGVSRSSINQSGIVFKLDDIILNTNPLEAGNEADDAVIVISDNLWDHIDSHVDCAFYRTQKGCGETNNLRFSVSIPLSTPIDDNLAPKNVLNPFIFATPNRWHGIGQPGRGLEVHLKNKKVSALFNNALFGAYDDNSDYPTTSFLSQNNMPWALELPVLWDHPVERVDLIKAYPEFVDYVQSEGQAAKNWYQRPFSEQRIISNQ